MCQVCLKRFFLCVYKVCLKRFFCVCQVCLKRNVGVFLLVSGMLRKNFFCMCQVRLKKKCFFLHVSGMFEKKCVFFACVRYV